MSSIPISDPIVYGVRLRDLRTLPSRAQLPQLNPGPVAQALWDPSDEAPLRSHDGERLHATDVRGRLVPLSARKKRHSGTRS